VRHDLPGRDLIVRTDVESTARLHGVRIILGARTVAVRGSDRLRLLPVEQVSWIEADGMYVKLHTRDGAVHVHRELLGALDDSLDPRRFVRIHRSAIVNIDVVVELRQEAHGDYVAVLRDRTEIRVGRSFRARLQARLGQQI
jgi:two-component system LytT family response regulator